MLKLRIPVSESFNDKEQKFVADFVELELEHSLVSLSKWEAEWEKPFLTEDDKTAEEIESYIKHMIVTPNVSPEVYSNFRQEDFVAIQQHIQKKHTATWFSDLNKKKSREVVTSEVVYHWMTALNIPMECETWHLNRLLTLIKVANEKSQPPKKKSRAEIAERNRKINEMNRARFNSKG